MILHTDGYPFAAVVPEQTSRHRRAGVPVRLPPREVTCRVRQADPA
jgi:hypothetical protein